MMIMMMTKTTMIMLMKQKSLLTWLSSNWAGHQQWMGSPTYCLVLTTMVKMIRMIVVYRWFRRSIQSSS